MSGLSNQPGPPIWPAVGTFFLLLVHLVLFLLVHVIFVPAPVYPAMKATVITAVPRGSDAVQATPSRHMRLTAQRQRIIPRMQLSSCPSGCK